MVQALAQRPFAGAAVASAVSALLEFGGLRLADHGAQRILADRPAYRKPGVHAAAGRVEDDQRPRLNAGCREEGFETFRAIVENIGIVLRGW